MLKDGTPSAILTGYSAPGEIVKITNSESPNACMLRYSFLVLV